MIDVYAELVVAYARLVRPRLSGVRLQILDHLTERIAKARSCEVSTPLVDIVDRLHGEVTAQPALAEPQASWSSSKAPRSSLIGSVSRWPSRRRRDRHRLGGPSDDFDLHVFDGDGNSVGSSIGDNPSSGVPMENVSVDKASGDYDILVNPFSVSDSDYTGHVALDSTKRTGKPPVGGEVPSEPLFDVACQGLVAGPFPCKNVDLGAYLPLSAIGGANRGNDIWGWTDPQTGREYALMGTTRGTSFVDVTDPTSPTYLGELLSHQPIRTVFRQWSDIKVYRNHAFVVSEEPLHGMQVFDLTRLRGVDEPQIWIADSHYGLFGGAHNIAINEASGFAYAIGTRTCAGGPHMIDIRQPKLPLFAGCVAEDGYTHDTQAVTHNGPDTDFNRA